MQSKIVLRNNAFLLSGAEQYIASINTCRLYLGIGII